MFNKLSMLALALALPLSACGGENATEEAAEAGADVLEAQADSVETVTDDGTGAMEEAGEMEADSLREEADAMEDAGEATDSTMEGDMTEDDASAQ
jgi:hypothetical protein